MSLSAERSREIITGALAIARELDAVVAVAVVDSGGFLVGLDRMTGARRLTPSIAAAKAYAAAVMERPSCHLRDWQARDPEFFAQVGRMGDRPIAAAEGGVPMKLEGTFLGAIGIAGAAPAHDQQIAVAALLQCGYELVFDAFPKPPPC